VILCAACSRQAQQGIGFIDPALATLTPADTTVLVGARLDKLRESATYQRHFANAHFPALDHFSQQTGLDPKKEVWEVLYASNGTDGILMTRGRFSPLDMEPRLQREGATRTSYRGYSLYGDEHSAVFFMNQTTALAGSTAALKRIVDAQNAGGDHGIPTGLLPLVRTIPPGAQFWAAFSSPKIGLPVPNESNLGNVNTILRTVGNGTFYADLAGGLKARALLNFASDEQAKQMTDSIRALLALGRAASAKKPELLRAYDQIHLSQPPRSLEVSADVPQELVDRLVEALGR
jgi:hypothetical protein